MKLIKSFYPLMALVLLLTACSKNDDDPTTTVETSQKEQLAANPDGYQYELDVVFHLLYNNKEDEEQYPEVGYMARIIGEVNKLYAANKMNITFRMATEDDRGNRLDEPGVMRHEVDFTDYSPDDFLDSKNEDNRQYGKLQQNLKKYINVFVFRFSQDDAEKSTMGITTLPVMPKAHPLDSLHTSDTPGNYAYTSSPWGCCINNEYLGEWQDDTSINPNFIVSTVAHELGHYLGLLHTFSMDECKEDDACSDTPSCDYMNYAANVTKFIQEQLAQGVTSFKITDLARRDDCLTARQYVAHNIMDYAYCYNDSLTQQQRQRTRQVLWYSQWVPGPKLTESGTTRGIAPYTELKPHVQPCPRWPKGSFNLKKLNN